MTYLTPILTGLLLSITSLVAPLLVLLALPFAKWDDFPSVARDGTTTIRGDLPNWLSWLSTPDERLPGGLYETEHKALLEKTGKYFASWYWLGWRNRLHGLRMALGKPTYDYITYSPGFSERGDIWHYSKQIGIFRFAAGYKVYKLLDGSFRAAPVCTVMVRR